MSAPAELPSSGARRSTVRLFLCGDVMTGRGIDQVMKCPCEPRLYEGYVSSALDYVHLAETANGAMPRRVDPAYVWGVALDELRRKQPDLRIINLETSLTRSEDYFPKGINYRMSPENADCLAAAGVDCCVLANNHVLDWGTAGLLDTLATLERLNIKIAGGGRNAEEAAKPAELHILGKGRVLIFAFVAVTSGAPHSWAAKQHRPGVNLLSKLSAASASHVCEQINRFRQPHDAVVVSVHWGPNWGYEVPEEQRRFAHALIDEGDVSIVYGHSSHHAKAIEVYRSRLILYGCGDFLNDYEGIQGYEYYRNDLGVMYFADIDIDVGNLSALELIPLQIRQFRLARPKVEDIEWVLQTLGRESRPFNTSVVMTSDGTLAVSLPNQVA